MVNKKKQIADFVEQYNKHMNWNKDILSNLKIDANYSKKFINDYIPTNKIDEISYDLEHAEVYVCENGTLELQVYSYKSYHVVYFWVKPGMTEQEYKEKKIKYVTESSNRHLDELKTKIDELIKEKEEFLKIKEELS